MLAFAVLCLRHARFPMSWCGASAVAGFLVAATAVGASGTPGLGGVGFGSMVASPAPGSDAVRECFARLGVSYPLHLSLPADQRPRIVCPDCEKRERMAPEYQETLIHGLEYLRKELPVAMLRRVTGAEAFLVSDAYLFEDPPGAPVALAVDLSEFILAAGENGGSGLPPVRHETSAGAVLERKNVLVFRYVDDAWAHLANPERIFYWPPRYPKKAHKKRLEATTEFKATVHEDGSVDSVEMLSCEVRRKARKASKGLNGHCPAFAEAAVDAIRRWRYRPGTHDGRPIAMFFTVVVEFALE